jgi:hypothetical protein
MPTFAQKTNIHGPSSAGFRKRASSVLLKAVAASAVLQAPIVMGAQLEEVVVTAQKKAERL